VAAGVVEVAGVVVLAVAAVVMPAPASAVAAISPVATTGPAVASAVAIASTGWATPPSVDPPPGLLVAWIARVAAEDSKGLTACNARARVCSDPMGAEAWGIAGRISGIGI
jgi:hypothetical protein